MFYVPSKRDHFETAPDVPRAEERFWDWAGGGGGGKKLPPPSPLFLRPCVLSLAKDVKLGKYTVPTGNRTLDRRVEVHYAIAAPRV